MGGPTDRAGVGTDGENVVDPHGGGASLDLDGAAIEVESTGATPVGDALWLLVRPGWAHLGGPLSGRLLAGRFRGRHSDYVVETAAGNVLIREPGPPRYAAGADVTWTLSRIWPLERPKVNVVSVTRA